MNAKTILFPTDFSRLSDNALHRATVLAKESNAKLLILHVEEPPSAYAGGEMYYGMPEPDHEALKEMLARITPHDPDLAFERRLEIGDPASEIVRVAEEEDVDMIVMATHGRTGLTRLLMGSVAESVVRHAPCAVLSLKEPHRAKDAQEESVR
ncbi:Universal stress protein UspA [Planctomycetales bacterium 10988]|nr:Universal stress protein UspA [Planctomycetales bacterium 10988]